MAHRPVARRRTQGSLRAAHAATASALALVLVLALALAGCTGSSEPPPPTPESTAAALAAGLSSGDLSRMPFDGSTPEAATTALGTVVAAIKDIPRTVTVVKVARVARARRHGPWDARVLRRVAPSGPDDLLLLLLLLLLPCDPCALAVLLSPRTESARPGARRGVVAPGGGPSHAHHVSFVRAALPSGRRGLRHHRGHHGADEPTDGRRSRLRRRAHDPRPFDADSLPLSRPDGPPG